jgi:hypothetical protein
MGLAAHFGIVKSLVLRRPRGWKSVLYNAALLKARRAGPLLAPAHVTIEPINACNARCPVCETGKGEMRRAAGFVDVALYKRFIDQIAPSTNTLMFYFMGEHAYDLIRCARLHDMFVETCTNGDLVDPEGVIHSDVNRISFQIGGLDEETRQRYRVRSSRSANATPNRASASSSASSSCATTSTRSRISSAGRAGHPAAHSRLPARGGHLPSVLGLRRAAARTSPPGGLRDRAPYRQPRARRRGGIGMEFDDFVALLRAAHRRSDGDLRHRFDRSLPFADGMFDRWERARALGFADGASIYDSALVYGDVQVGAQSWIGPNVMLDGSGGPVCIGAFCSLAAGAHLYTHDTVLWAVSGGKLGRRTGAVAVADCVYIGAQGAIAAKDEHEIVPRFGQRLIELVGEFIAMEKRDDRHDPAPARQGQPVAERVGVDHRRRRLFADPGDDRAFFGRAAADDAGDVGFGELIRHDDAVAEAKDQLLHRIGDESAVEKIAPVELLRDAVVPAERDDARNAQQTADDAADQTSGVRGAATDDIDAFTADSLDDGDHGADGAAAGRST